MGDFERHSERDFSDSINGLCAEFADLWKREKISIEGFLATRISSTDFKGLSQLKLRLVETEIRIRRESGETPNVLDYCERFDGAIEDDVSLLFSVEFPPMCGRANGAELPSRYTRLEKVGEGGIGTVWRVVDGLFNRALAAKFLHQKYASDSGANLRLEREALITGQLQHPGIPPVHDIGKLTNGSSFFTMKLVHGQTLRDILRSRKDTLPNETELVDLVGTFELIAQAMAYAHSENVIHRDLKPSNVMVGQFGEVQIMDWGLAKKLNDHQANDPKVIRSAMNLLPPTGSGENCEADDRVQTKRASFDSSQVDPLRTMTIQGDVFGTPAFMPPEQARGDVDAMGFQSDVFGLGGILFEILTRHRLYEDVATGELLKSAAIAALGPSLEKLKATNAHPELISICNDCLKPDPKDRPENAQAVADRVSGYIRSFHLRLKEAELEKSNTELKLIEEQKRRRLSSILVCTILAAIGMAVVGYGWYQFDLERKTAANDAERAATLVDAIAVAPVDAIPFAVENAKSLAVNVKPLLISGFEDATDPVQKYHLAIALSCLGESQGSHFSYLAKNIAQVPIGELSNLIHALRVSPELATDCCRSAFKSEGRREARARLAAAALYLGEPRLMALMTNEQADFRDRLEFIGLFRRWSDGVSPFFLKLESVEGPLSKYALLCAVAEMEDRVSDSEIEQFGTQVKELAQASPTACVRSASELLLKRWNLSLPDLDVGKPTEIKDWYRNPAGMVMVQLDQPKRSGKSRFDKKYSFYVADREVTVSQFRQFFAEDEKTAGLINKSRDSETLREHLQYRIEKLEGCEEFDQPMLGVGGYLTIRFCNWLSEKEGLEPCYTIDAGHESTKTFSTEYHSEPWVFSSDADGYRLPNYAEYDFLASGLTPYNPAQSKPTFHQGDATHHPRYEWYLKNASGIQPVASKLPNRFGLFDTLGNLQEFTRIRSGNTNRGHAWTMFGKSHVAPNLISEQGKQNLGVRHSTIYATPDMGFRVARVSKDELENLVSSEINEVTFKHPCLVGEISSPKRMLDATFDLNEAALGVADRGYDELAVEVLDYNVEILNNLLAEHDYRQINCRIYLGGALVNGAISLNQLGRQKEALKRLESAEVQLNLALNESPGLKSGTRFLKNMKFVRSQSWLGQAELLACSNNDGKRDGDKAVELVEKAIEHGSKTGKNFEIIAASYAEQGDFEKAIQWQEKAVELEENSKGKNSVAEIEQRKSVLRLFEDQKPLRFPK